MTETKPEHSKAEPEVQPPVLRPKSKGEKFFDRFVYAGIAALGTFIITVPITYLLKYHGRVAPHFERTVDWMHRGLSKIFPSIKRETSDKILTTTALMQGGNLMVVPVGIFEHHKVPIVSGLNTMMGDPTPPEQIEKAPKQTWGSLLESRIVAWLAVFAAFKGAEKFVPKTLTMFEDEVGKRMCEIFKKPQTRTIAGKTVESKTYLFGKIGALDFFATIAAATLLYVGGHFFARKQEQRKEQRKARHNLPSGIAQADAGERVEGAETSARAVVSGEKAHAGRVAEAPVLARV